jgi:hypothetical protein
MAVTEFEALLRHAKGQIDDEYKRPQLGQAVSQTGTPPSSRLEVPFDMERVLSWNSQQLCRSSEQNRHTQTEWPLTAQPLHSQLQTSQHLTPWPLVRERTIPTERPPLVDEI